MDHSVITDRTGQQWARVTKPTARRCFNGGQEVTLTPHKISPFTSKASTDTYSGTNCLQPFDSVDASFIGAVCGKEVGMYPAYYVKAN